ncbi:M20/M25/M40 family metallo-hydrolase [Acidobacteria bacterium AH-259-L09]|nr:M20/M25/M40 family metallo-hydrolase [Acidobacteria bacterium AH-259-L09]
MLDVIDLTRKLVDIPSVTGQEKEAGEFLYDLLQREGWDCLKQKVTSDRFNVLATRGKPAILLTTHMDTVPDFFPSMEDEKFVYGRGACDAKGIAAAMICAAQGLLQEDFTDVGLLFVVGEETDSAGAIKTQELNLDCSFFINGEPTDNQLVIGHKGMIYARLCAEGVSAHSAYPEKGESAIDKLISILNSLKQTAFPADPQLGQTYLNIGRIEGGKAANVLADFAEAEILIRTVCESRRYLEILDQVVGDQGRLQVVKTSEPQEMEAVEGFSTKVVGYGTDIPALRPLGKPLLFGPGSIFEAHTAREKVSKQELVDAIGLYQRLVRALRARTIEQ